MTATHWICAVCGKLATSATANLFRGTHVIHRGCDPALRDSRKWNTEIESVASKLRAEWFKDTAS